MAREIKPIEPVSAEQHHRLRNELELRIILFRKPDDNSWTGYIENSFSMGEDKGHTLMFFTGKYSNAVRESTEHVANIRALHPSFDIHIFDPRAEDLPVILDWEAWINAQAYNPNTLSGVSHKFKARNIPFKMPDMESV